MFVCNISYKITYVCLYVFCYCYLEKEKQINIFHFSSLQHGVNLLKEINNEIKVILVFLYLLIQLIVILPFSLFLRSFLLPPPPPLATPPACLLPPLLGLHFLLILRTVSQLDSLIPPVAFNLSSRVICPLTHSDQAPFS